MDGGIGANTSEWLLCIRNRCSIKLKIGRRYFVSVIVCRSFRGASPLDLGVVAASCRWYIYHLLSSVDKAMNNRNSRFVPNQALQLGTTYSDVASSLSCSGSSVAP